MVIIINASIIVRAVLLRIRVTVVYHEMLVI